MARDNKEQKRNTADAQAAETYKPKGIAVLDRETGEDVSAEYVVMPVEEAVRRREFGKALGKRQEAAQKRYLKGKRQKEKSTETGVFIFSTFKNRGDKERVVPILISE